MFEELKKLSHAKIKPKKINKKARDKRAEKSKKWLKDILIDNTMKKTKKKPIAFSLKCWGFQLPYKLKEITNKLKEKNASKGSNSSRVY